LSHKSVHNDSAAALAAPATHQDPEVIVFNLKNRYTGVSATVNALVPLQATQWRLGYCGSVMSNGVQGMTLPQAIKLSRIPAEGRDFRIWHVRRDHEMLAGIFARDILRLPVKLVFTSAAQHLHGAFPRWLISQMDAVISTTDLAASFVPNTTAVVPHGIDLLRFSRGSDKLTAWEASGLPGRFGIGVFGRVRLDKGTDVFVEAMLEALPKLPGVTAVIAGLAQPQHQSFEKALMAKIAQAGMTDRIIFLGEVPASEVHIWYQRCLLCVACPRYEPFGLTPFEAAATGCAVVCSRTGAFEQLVQPGVNGELVPTGDAAALAAAVLRVMSDPKAAVKMGERARERVILRFSLQAEAAGIGRVYQSMFDGK
jgi:mannosyltransferase